MASQMELLALATLHEFPSSLVFQSVLYEMKKSKAKNKVKSKISTQRSEEREKIFHHFHIKVLPFEENARRCEKL